MRAASSFLIWKHRLKFKRFKCSLSRLQSWRVRRSERRAGEAPGQAQFATRSLLVWTSVNKVRLSIVGMLAGILMIFRSVQQRDVDWFVWIASRAEVSMHCVPAPCSDLPYDPSLSSSGIES